MKKQSKEIEQLQKQHDELKEMLQRNLAEFQNYQKRTQQDKENLTKTATQHLIKELLPILDNFELALQNKSSHEELVKGVEMIYTQLLETLENQGLQKINTQGKFDPNQHEALMAEESDKEENTITYELQKGYTLNNKVIRHAKVKISKGDKK